MSWFLSCIGCGTKYLPDKNEEKTLDFQHCSLVAVPFEVFESERFLEELYLDFNQLTELAPSLFHCHELQVLSLSDNDVHFIPEAISSLKNLISLNFSKNGIGDIPDSIKNCKKIEYLNASTNPLCRLPEGFTQLVALKELCLNETFLEYLPANFGRLSGLEVLDLRENQLNFLPLSMSRLSALKRIDLGQNEFSDVPEVVGHLTNLTDFWIDNNKISSLPSEIGNLPNLTFLDASKNLIKTITPKIGNCKNLADLYLNNNYIEEFPDELCQCVSLKHLHVDNNELKSIPENFGHLDSLVEINMCTNDLSSFPCSCGLLRKLKILHIDDNKLTSLPSDIGSCVELVILTASHNHLSLLPAELGNLSRLKVVNVSRNKLDSLPVSFTKLELNALWLSENQTKPLFPLQSVINRNTGHKVLTCVMLPQEPRDDILKIPEEEEEELDSGDELLENRKLRNSIHFASENLPENPGSLSRTPTPYPKELRALARHTRNQALKKCVMVENVDSFRRADQNELVNIPVTNVHQESNQTHTAEAHNKVKMLKNSSRPASIASPEELSEDVVRVLPSGMPISKRPLSLAFLTNEPNFTNHPNSKVSQSCANINFSLKDFPKFANSAAIQKNLISHKLSNPSIPENRVSHLGKYPKTENSPERINERSPGGQSSERINERSPGGHSSERINTRLNSSKENIHPDSELVSIINQVTDDLSDGICPPISQLENSSPSDVLDSELKQNSICSDELPLSFSMGQPSNLPVKVGQLTTPSKVKLGLLANDIPHPIGDSPSKGKQYVPFTAEPEATDFQDNSPNISANTGSKSQITKIPQLRSPTAAPSSPPALSVTTKEISSPTYAKVSKQEYIPFDTESRNISDSSLSKIPRFVTSNDSPHSKASLPPKNETPQQRSTSKIPSLSAKSPQTPTQQYAPDFYFQDSSKDKVSHSNWKPKISGKEPLSPVEKPINTTGIPLPSGSSSYSGSPRVVPSEKYKKSNLPFSIAKYSTSTVVPKSESPGSSLAMKNAWLDSTRS